MVPELLVCDWKLRENFTRAPLSCLPSILPLPIIVNQSGIISTMGGAVRQATARAAGCGEQYAAIPAWLPGCQPRRGPPGAPSLAAPPGQDATAKTETFRFTAHSAHG